MMNTLRNFIRSVLNEGRLIKDFGALSSNSYRVVQISNTNNDYQNSGKFIIVDPTLTISQINDLIEKTLNVRNYPTYKDYQTAYELFKEKNPKTWWKDNSGSPQEYKEFWQIKSGNSLIVNVKDKLIDVDVGKFTNVMTRRGDKRRNVKSYTMPSAGIGFQAPKIFKDVLRFVMKNDKRVTTDYGIVGNPAFKNRTIRDVLGSTEGADALKNSGELTFYHGTSLKRWSRIEKSGLNPGNAPEVYVDLVPGFSEKNVYLTTSVETAENYATRAAIDDRSQAVVLKVIIRDPTKLRPDEDSMGWITVTDPDGDEVEVHFRHNNWRSWPNASQIHQRFMSGVAKSINSNGTIAYAGRIPARDVSELERYKPVSMKHDPTSDEYWNAMDKTRKGLKFSGG